jgi:ABC-type polysaccharide/polyol phosphate transport system ATPase subunit
VIPTPPGANGTPGLLTLDCGSPLVEAQGLGVWFPRRRRRREKLSRPPTGRPEDAGVIWALRDVSFRGCEGQIVAIVGPNGAGKTTLCQVMAGVLAPDEGGIHVAGRVTALLSLEAALEKDLSGRDNVRLGAALLGLTRREVRRRMDEIIEFAELQDVIDEPLRAYSRGMRTRLALAVACTIDPDILILDELLAGGDLGFQRKSERRIAGLVGRSRLIVLVTHSMAMLRRLCTHALWLHEGRIVRAGAAQEVLDAYEQASLEPGHG